MSVALGPLASVPPLPVAGTFGVDRAVAGEWDRGSQRPCVFSRGLSADADFLSRSELEVPAT